MSCFVYVLCKNTKSRAESLSELGATLLRPPDPSVSGELRDRP